MRISRSSLGSRQAEDLPSRSKCEQGNELVNQGCLAQVSSRLRKEPELNEETRVVGKRPVIEDLQVIPSIQALCFKNI